MKSAKGSANNSSKAKGNKFPSISIVTPTFNAAKTFQRTIDSILGQNYPALEYIVVDGGSRDETLDIVRKHPQAISKWISEKDKGIYDAMNKGVKLASGDWIGILNADDKYSEGVLETLRLLIERNPDVDVFYADIRMVFTSMPPYVYKSSRSLSLHAFWRMPVWHPTMFVRREVYEKWGVFQDGYRVAADYEFVLRLFKKGVRFHHVDSLWVEMLGGGASDVSWKKGKQEIRKIAEGYGVFAGRLRIFFHLDIWKIELSQRIQTVPVLKMLQSWYRLGKSKLKPGF